MWKHTPTNAHANSTKFAVNDSPTIAWVFPAGSIDQNLVSGALKRAVTRRVPWLNARVARTQSGSVSIKTFK
jgi:hypothetical protein